MPIIRGTGSNKMTNGNQCGGNIKGGLAPNVGITASSNRSYRSQNPATITKKDMPAKCVSGDEYHPKYCCPGGVGLMYTNLRSR